MEDNVQDEDIGILPAKRIKLSSEDDLTPSTHKRGLLDLSDDVLLIIFAFLSPTDLINLSQSCTRLWNVTRDRTLWTHVDCRENYLDSDVFEETYVDYLLPCTKFLAVDFRIKSRRKKGRRLRLLNTQGVLTASLLGKVTQTCTNLHTLILQDVSFDAQQIPVRYFPSTLTYLSLKNSDVRNLPVRVSYFNEIHLVMPNLQVLILSHSLWLESHSLMAISKCLKLEELRLQGCFSLGDCIAYFSIATRFGFKALETLDLRGTQVGDPEVSCLNLVPTLRHLYLESISQYARRRDAEYYMNRVRQFPDITIVPHPNAGPVQNPVILLQRIDGEMVARNVTNEFHDLTQARDGARTCPHGVATTQPEPGTSRAAPTPTITGCMRTLAEKWDTAFRTNPEQPSTSQGTHTTPPSRFVSLFNSRFQVPDGHFGDSSSRGPVVVVPMPQRRTTTESENREGAASSSSTSSNGRSLANLLENETRTYRFSALEHALRIRGVLTVINDKTSSSYPRNFGSQSAIVNVNDPLNCDKHGVQKSSTEATAGEAPSGVPERLTPELKLDEASGTSGTSATNGTTDGQSESGQRSSTVSVADGREQSSSRDADKPDRVEDATEQCEAGTQNEEGVEGSSHMNAKGRRATRESDSGGCEPRCDADAQGKSPSDGSQNTNHERFGRVILDMGNMLRWVAVGGTRKQKCSEEPRSSNNRDEAGPASDSHIPDQSDGDRSSSRLEESTSAVISSDTNDSDCGREGGDEEEDRSSSGANCKRFKKPLVHNPNGVGSSRMQSSAYESDDDSDVGTENTCVNYREYLSKYVKDNNSNLRVKALKNLKKRLNEAKKGDSGNNDCLPSTYSTDTKEKDMPEENKTNSFTVDNGPGCSYVTQKPPTPHMPTPIILDCGTSLPSCSKYEPQHYKVYSGTSESSFSGGPCCSRSETKKYKLPIVRREQRNHVTKTRKRPSVSTSDANDNDEGNYSSEGDGNSDTSPNGVDPSRRVHSMRISEESESDSPDVASDSDDERDLHFCTIGRARFPGLTMPFFHRVPQVTNSCVHAICSGKSYVRPQLGYNIMTLRANPKEPTQECRLETLVLRHFTKITDQSLYVLSKLTSLRFLDVTGTSVTACGVKNFRLMRPDVQVTSDHDNPIEP